jgi:hypothetical protein
LPALARGLFVHEASSSLCAFERLNIHERIAAVIVDARSMQSDVLCRYVLSTRPKIRLFLIVACAKAGNLAASGVNVIEAPADLDDVVAAIRSPRSPIRRCLNATPL